MRDRTRRGLDVLQAAFILGIVGDALLRATPWGLNVLLWMVLFVTAGFMLLARWRRKVLSNDARLIILPLLFFAACFVWRDSPTLQLLDGLAILLALSLMILRTRAASLRWASIKEHTVAIFMSVFDSAFGLPTILLGDVEWKEIPHSRLTRHMGAVLRGLLIAAPLILLFGGLLMAADAVFEGLINHAFDINAELLLSHVGLTTLFAWLAGGLLRGALNEPDAVLANSSDSGLLSLNITDANKTIEVEKKDSEKKDDDKSDSPFAHRHLSLSIVEIGVAIGLIDLLFLAFVTVQIRYFFGGSALVQATTGLTYAEYARRGFFELVWVTALVLPVLLIAHWLLRKENPVHERIFRVLAGAQVALLFVIMASAAGRVRLYQREYGLTEQRFYTIAFMVWLGAVFIWFAWTVLRGARERFSWGTLVAGFMVVGFLHAINPDALIVRANISHAETGGRGFDASYATGLSADAVPALAASLPAMNQDQRCLVAASLLSRWPENYNADWRTWNWSRREAHQIILSNAANLRALACPQVETNATLPPEATVQNEIKE